MVRISSLIPELLLAGFTVILIALSLTMHGGSIKVYVSNVTAFSTEPLRQCNAMGFTVWNNSTVTVTVGFQLIWNPGQISMLNAVVTLKPHSHEYVVATIPQGQDIPIGTYFIVRPIIINNTETALNLWGKPAVGICNITNPVVGDPYMNVTFYSFGYGTYVPLDWYIYANYSLGFNIVVNATGTYITTGRSTVLEIYQSAATAYTQLPYSTMVAWFPSQ